MSVVENTDPQHLRLAAWAFPLYLLLINLPVLPLALFGRLLLPEETRISTCWPCPWSSGTAPWPCLPF